VPPDVGDACQVVGVGPQLVAALVEVVGGEGVIGLELGDPIGERPGVGAGVGAVFSCADLR